MKNFHFKEIGELLYVMWGLRKKGGGVEQRITTVLLFSLTADWFENRGGWLMPRECHTFLPMKTLNTRSGRTVLKWKGCRSGYILLPCPMFHPSTVSTPPTDPILHPQPYVHPFFTCDTHFSIPLLLFATMGLKIGVGFRQRNAYIYACSLNKYDSEGSGGTL